MYIEKELILYNKKSCCLNLCFTNLSNSSSRCSFYCFQYVSHITYCLSQAAFPSWISTNPAWPVEFIQHCISLELTLLVSVVQSKHRRPKNVAINFVHCKLRRQRIRLQCTKFIATFLGRLWSKAQKYMISFTT